jgi:multiple sugar transport system ATP-binding protein
MGRLDGASGRDLIAGIRPEHFEDSSLVGDDLGKGVTFTADIDVIEWMGSELYVYFDMKGGSAGGVEVLPEELVTSEVPSSGGSIVARLDPASMVKEQSQAELWLDARRIHLFDRATGDNLSLGQSADANVEAAR